MGYFVAEYDCNGVLNVFHDSLWMKVDSLDIQVSFLFMTASRSKNSFPGILLPASPFFPVHAPSFRLQQVLNMCHISLHALNLCAIS